MEALKLFIYQKSIRAGDIAGNLQLLKAAMQEAAGAHADVLLTPELSLSGYMAKDYFENESFIDAAQSALEELIEASKSFPALLSVVGVPHRENGALYNSAALIQNGSVRFYNKTYLPNYAVFDERRYFTASDAAPFTFELKGNRCGLCICEDFWSKAHMSLYREAGVKLLFVVNASPYEKEKLASRLELLKTNATDLGMTAVYVNAAGARDGVLFDGRSLAADSEGLKMALGAFSEEKALLTVSEEGAAGPAVSAPEDGIETVYAALVYGLAEYLQENRFPGVVLGLSGGVDSALVLKIAADAAGAENVHAVMMPSPYTSQMSLDDAAQLADNLGVRYSIIPIAPIFEAYKAGLAQEFAGLKEDLTEENLQARIRGTLLMAISNKQGKMLAATGNKSEVSVGYSTLYGDTCGGYAPISDVFKTEVYALCRWLNARAGRDIIPERVLSRAPSAELRPDQKDEDSLPSYAVLDEILRLYIEKKYSKEKILQLGLPEATVSEVIGLLRKAEYKRRQCPFGTKISAVAFGDDWRFPVKSYFYS
jgi:NAD+ synthetase